MAVSQEKTFNMVVNLTSDWKFSGKWGSRPFGKKNIYTMVYTYSFSKWCEKRLFDENADLGRIKALEINDR